MVISIDSNQLHSEVKLTRQITGVLYLGTRTYVDHSSFLCCRLQVPTDDAKLSATPYTIGMLVVCGLVKFEDV